ncbi:fibrobacter succinogenes major paralogous domain-containing protein [Chlorobaculum limnaeum]|nr:fibrobacter succinogenes major paralogous domain-containing protein [Chlorobaculum limnaeum]
MVWYEKGDSLKTASLPEQFISEGSMIHQSAHSFFRKSPLFLFAVLLLFTSGCTKQDDAAQGITIGRQIWMAENLATDRYRNGDKIRHARSVEEWNEAISKQEGAWCDYGNDPDGGRLYNWFAVADSRGLAPAGWRVPTDEEWRELEAATDGQGFATGFTGSRNCLGLFFGKGTAAFFWTATPSGEFDAWNREISEGSRKLQRVSVAKGLGLSVRCVKDREK